MIDYKPTIAIHPGEILEDNLEHYGVTQKWLSDRTGLTEKNISEIINQKAPITATTAIKLANVFGGTSNFWLNLDLNYRSTKARIRQEEQAKSEIELSRQIPYKEMVKFGWIEDSKNDVEKVLNLYKFFGISSLKYIETCHPVAFRQSNTGKKNIYAIAAWLRKSEIEAEKITDIDEYDPIKLKQLLSKIKQLSYTMPQDFYDQLVAILKSCGVILVAVKYLAGTNICGATKWINGHPIIQLSDYRKQDDTMWFTLFHEIGHILLHGKKGQFIEFDGIDKYNEEAEADNFASNTLINDGIFCDFIMNHQNKQITKKDILYFAEKEKISPSILLGRLKKEGKIEYKYYNDLHKKVSVRAQ